MFNSNKGKKKQIERSNAEKEKYSHETHKSFNEKE